eukprot:2384352-Amphidinium_carterae.1
MCGPFNSQGSCRVNNCIQLVGRCITDWHDRAERLSLHGVFFDLLKPALQQVGRRPDLVIHRFEFFFVGPAHFKQAPFGQSYRGTRGSLLCLLTDNLVTATLAHVPSVNQTSTIQASLAGLFSSDVLLFSVQTEVCHEVVTKLGSGFGVSREEIGRCVSCIYDAVLKFRGDRPFVENVLEFRSRHGSYSKELKSRRGRDAVFSVCSQTLCKKPTS